MMYKKRHISQCIMTLRRVVKLSLVQVTVMMSVTLIVSLAPNVATLLQEYTPHAYAERSMISIAKRSKWEKILTKNGVTLFSATRAGSSLPLLKGQTTLNHNPTE